MYKDEPIKLSIDGEEDEYEFDENKLQYRKGHKPKVAARIHKNRSKRGGGNCSDYICKKYQCVNFKKPVIYYRNGSSVDKMLWK